MMGETASISFTCFRMLSTSRFRMFHWRPLLKPLYDSLVRSEKKKAEFVANPLIFENIAFFIPFPAPNRITNIRMPQNTPKQVNKLRVLFRVIVTHISTHLSMSNMVLFFFMIIPFSWLR